MATKTVSFKAPEKQVKMIEKLVEEKGYTSKGELLRDLVRKELEPELTEQAKEKIKNARKEIEKAKGEELG
ncbi:MAG: ribbon-helix-helix domain-containing protein [Candidatus Nanohaloarchaeota archaeon QJJ-9]|nr:ribbon-helix-helix domain-containing protein [Candidatus Nanohaloarchaeota archaeon QJJ-9]